MVVVCTGGTVQTDRVIVSVSRVTAPFRARVRPFTVTPVVTVIEVSARMLPTKLDPVPSVAELPTCQKTLHAWAPPMRVTVLAEAVTRVLAVLKMKTALGSPCASRVRLPVIAKVPEAEAYTPGATGVPMVPRSVGRTASTGRAAASVYAAVRSVWAWAAVASAAWMVPLTTPGGKPVTAEPGLTPRSPVTTVAPVLVTVVPARTAKLAAVPSGTGGGDAAFAACGVAAKSPMVTIETRMAASHGRTLSRARYGRRVPFTKSSPCVVTAWV